MSSAGARGGAGAEASSLPSLICGIDFGTAAMGEPGKPGKPGSQEATPPWDVNTGQPPTQGVRLLRCGYCIARRGPPGSPLSACRVFPFKPGDRSAGATEKNLTCVLLEDAPNPADMRPIAIGKEARRRFFDMEPDERSRVVYLEQFKMVMAPSRRGTRSLFERTVHGLGAERAIPLVTAVAKVLEYIRVEALERVRAMGVDEREVGWVLTVPAIWDDTAKALMRRAAFEGGLVDEEFSPRLQLALEPEGAIIAAATEASEDLLSRLVPGTSIAVLDCGGGTVDVTVSTVSSSSPFQLRELLPPSGDAWGGTMVDAQFRKFANDLLAPPGASLASRADPGLLSQCMEAWEGAKCGWDPDDAIRSTVVVSGLAGVCEAVGGAAVMAERVAAFNAANGFVGADAVLYRRSSFSLSIPSSLVRQFYDACVQPICAHTLSVLHDAALAGSPVRFIFLVGGFAESVYLQRAVTSCIATFSPPPSAAAADPYAIGGGAGAGAATASGSASSVVLVVPHKPVQVVNRGSALWGLFPTAFVLSRKAKFTYVVEMLERYNPAVHDPLPDPSYLAHAGDGRVYAGCIAYPLLHKGDDVPVDWCAHQQASPMGEEQTKCSIQIYRTEATIPRGLKGDKRAYIWHNGLKPCATFGSMLMALVGSGARKAYIGTEDKVASIECSVGGPELGPRTARQVDVDLFFGRTEISAVATGRLTRESKKVVIKWS